MKVTATTTQTSSSEPYDYWAEKIADTRLLEDGEDLESFILMLQDKKERKKFIKALDKGHQGKASKSKKGKEKPGKNTGKHYN